jgi:glycosyltransferase involved in cell wall biosynthesis
MERLPFRTLGLVGHPLQRRLHATPDQSIAAGGTVGRAVRFALRRAGVQTLEGQDTRAVVEYLRKERVEVMLAEYGPSALTLMDACRVADVPLVTHFHGWDAYVLAPKPEMAPRYAALFRQSAAIIAVSRHMQSHLIALGAPPERTVWNPCGAEVAPLQARPGSNAPVFLGIGRSAPKKATVVSLLAFARVLPVVPDARLVLVGSIADASTHQLLRALGIQHAVEFMGNQPHERVLALMQDARCYLHPSVTAPDGDMEGTPVSVLEAMAAGVPVVSTRHGGILDVLDGTGAGLLADEYDVAATAGAMLTYATDAERANADGARGRELLAAKWSMRHSLDRLAAIVQAVQTRDARQIAALV